ncbi:MAG: class I SAM-dependent methyltransferase [Parvularculaceae bacterium]|nr:class I SAM-dependent methyltransferase [Parvularculaceae bacterium]
MTTRWVGSWRVSIDRKPYAAQELAHLYNRSASGWDRLVALLGTCSAYQQIFQRLVGSGALVAQNGPLKVLDGGIGTAAMALALAQCWPGALDLTGVDLSTDMLSRAASLLAQQGISANLLRGDIASVELVPQSFDLAMIGHVIEHMADPSEALSSVLKSLRPGGRLVLVATRRSWLSLPVQLRYRTHRWASAETARMLRFAGFTDVAPLHGVGGAVFQGLSFAMTARKPLDTE